MDRDLGREPRQGVVREMDHGPIGREAGAMPDAPIEPPAGETSGVAARLQASPTHPMGATIVELDRVTPASRADRNALVAEAFAAYHAELYNFLCRSTRDEAAAEDLVQEAYTRLTREVDAGRAPEHIRGWLYRVASNLVISRGRRSSTAIGWLNRHGRVAATEYEESPEAGYLRHERSSALEESLAALPAETRVALQLSADGFSGEEIAAAIGRTNGATRTLLSRARVKVRLEMERRETAR